MPTVSEHDSEDESEDDQGLLIEQLAKEGQHDDKNSDSEKNLEIIDNIGNHEVVVNSGEKLYDESVEKQVDVEADKNCSMDVAVNDSDSTPPDKSENSWIVPSGWVLVTHIVLKEHDQSPPDAQLANDEWPSLIQVT